MPHSGGDGPGSPISVERRQPGFQRAGGSRTPPGAASRSRMGRRADRACLRTVSPSRGGAAMTGQSDPSCLVAAAMTGCGHHIMNPPLCGDRLCDIVRARIIARFGKDIMCIHDFRRAASTFLAMDAPEQIGLIPGVLQHASPDVNDRHYNLKRTMQAGRRFAAHLSNARNRLRLLATKSSTVHAETTATRPMRSKHIDRPERDDALRSSGTIKHRDRGEPSCA